MTRKDKIINILISEENPYHLELLSATIANVIPNAEIDFRPKKKTYNLIFCDSIAKIVPFRKTYSKTPLIVFDSFSDEAKATQAIKLGALDYLPKSKESLEKIPQILKKWRQKSPKPSA